MDKKEIYLDLPDEVIKGLIDNQIDLKNYIAEEVSKKEDDIEFDLDYKYLKTDDDTSRTKDLTPVIITGIASVPVIIYAVDKLVNTILTRPRERVIQRFDEQGRLVEEEPIILQPKRNKSDNEFENKFEIPGYRSSPFGFRLVFVP